MKYDPQNFESVISYMRQEFGASVFREPERMHSIFCDLSPKLKPYGNVMRQLIERGALEELEAASGDDTRQARAFMKARDVLENELLLGADRVEDFLGVLRTLYGVAPTPKSAPEAEPKKRRPGKRAAQPAPTPKIVKRGECGDKGGNVTFTLDENGVLTISGKGAMRDFWWDSKTQSLNTPWWDEREVISRVEIQDSVSSIGGGAFRGCANLKSVTIPDSVTSIGDSAFAGCTGLTSVTIPDSVTSIERGAFINCAGLTSVVISDSVTSIGEAAFSSCTSLESVTIPDSVTSIGEAAFSVTIQSWNRKLTKQENTKSLQKIYTHSANL